MEKYERIVEEIGERSGWDFSGVSSEEVGAEVKFGYVKTVKEYLSGEEYLLDIGTGGGEVLLSLATRAKRCWGIDKDDDMVKTARCNLRNSSKKNLRFLVADGAALPFPDGFFDLVVCRQAPFFAGEVHRVLRFGGVFATQQVRENDKINIKRAFGRGQSYEKRFDELYEGSLIGLKAAGFTVLTKEKSDVTTYLKSVKDLVKLLTWSPIIPDFDANSKEDRESLKIIEREYGADKGIRTNTSRFLLVARKTDD